MSALLTLSFPLSTYFGNAKPSTRCSRAPKPVMVLDRTKNNRALHVERAAGGGRGSAISRWMLANRFREMATSPISKAIYRPWLTTSRRSR